MGDCAADLEKSVMPASLEGGIYDFSGTQATHCYAESGISITKEEIATLTKGFWDGASTGWTTDAEYHDTAGAFAPVIAGEKFICLSRTAFGDGDSMHVFRMKSKTKGSKRFCTFSHADYTMVISITDEEKGFAQGPAQIAVQALTEAYKEAGY